MEIKYHVPTKSYIYHTQLDPFLDYDRNYNNKKSPKKIYFWMTLTKKKNIVKQVTNPTNLGHKYNWGTWHYE